MTQPFEFYWTVPDFGYVIVEAPGAKGKRKVRCLAERLDGRTGQFRITKPLDETTLFREFAALHPATEEKILAFANAHGRLFHPGGDAWELERLDSFHGNALFTIPGRAEAGAGESFSLGESLDYWAGQVADMAEAVKLWEGSSSEPGAQVDLGAVSIVNEHLRQHPFSVALSPDRARRLARTLALEVNPESLLATLWLNFARAIEGGKQYRPCQNCGNYFEVYGSKREDAKFCRDTCRSMAYRRRIEQARKLRAEGMTVKKIADKLGSDEKTVKGWVKK